MFKPSLRFRMFAEHKQKMAHNSRNVKYSNKKQKTNPYLFKETPKPGLSCANVT